MKCIATGLGTAERASVKTASLRSLAFVRLQRLSRKSSGCMLVMHIVLRASSKERICESGLVTASLLQTASEARLHFARVAHLFVEKRPNVCGTVRGKVFANLHSRYRCTASAAFVFRVWKAIIAVLMDKVK